MSSFLSPLYILEFRPLSDAGLVKIFSYSVGCLFVLMTMSFALQKLLCFSRSHLFNVHVCDKSHSCIFWTCSFHRMLLSQPRGLSEGTMANMLDLLCFSLASSLLYSYFIAYNIWIVIDIKTYPTIIRQYPETVNTLAFSTWQRPGELTHHFGIHDGDIAIISVEYLSSCHRSE